MYRYSRYIPRETSPLIALVTLASVGGTMIGINKLSNTINTRNKLIHNTQTCNQVRKVNNKHSNT